MCARFEISSTHCALSSGSARARVALAVFTRTSSFFYPSSTRVSSDSQRELYCSTAFAIASYQLVSDMKASSRRGTASRRLQPKRTVARQQSATPPPGSSEPAETRRNVTASGRREARQRGAQRDAAKTRRAGGSRQRRKNPQELSDTKEDAAAEVPAGTAGSDTDAGAPVGSAAAPPVRSATQPPEWKPTPTKGARQTYGDCVKGVGCLLWGHKDNYVLTSHFCRGCYAAMHSGPRCDWAFDFRNSEEFKGADQEEMEASEGLHLCSEACAVSFLSRSSTAPGSSGPVDGTVPLRKYLARITFNGGSDKEDESPGREAQGRPMITPQELITPSPANRASKSRSGSAAAVDRDHERFPAPDFEDASDADDKEAEICHNKEREDDCQVPPPQSRPEERNREETFLSKNGKVMYEKVPRLQCVIAKNALRYNAVQASRGDVEKAWENVYSAVVEEMSHFPSLCSTLTPSKLRERFRILMSKKLPEMENECRKTGKGDFPDEFNKLLTYLRDARGVKDAQVLASSAEKQKRERKRLAGVAAIGVAIAAQRGMPNYRATDFDETIARATVPDSTVPPPASRNDVAKNRTSRKRPNAQTTHNRAIDSESDEDDDDEPRDDCSDDPPAQATGPKRRRATAQDKIMSLEEHLLKQSAQAQSEEEKERAHFQKGLDGALEKVGNIVAASNKEGMAEMSATLREVFNLSGGALAHDMPTFTNTAEATEKSINDVRLDVESFKNSVTESISELRDEIGCQARETHGLVDKALAKMDSNMSALLSAIAKKK